MVRAKVGGSNGKIHKIEPKSTNITVKFPFKKYYNEISIDSAFSAPTLPDK